MYQEIVIYFIYKAKIVDSLTNYFTVERVYQVFLSEKSCTKTIENDGMQLWTI